MPTRPEDLYAALCDAYNAGDLDALLALYDPEAVYVIKPGRVTRGRAELRAAMAHNLALRGRLVTTPDSFTQAGDVMLVLGSFTLAGQRRDGTAFERTARFADVLRRQPDGAWLIAVDNPFGDAPG
jgi:uncharacterized protein (TIGR02246 family)